MTNAESALCAKSRSGAAHITSAPAIRAALWMPFPCLWGRRAAEEELFVFLLLFFLFLPHLCGGAPHACLKQQVFTKRFQDVLWECIRITTTFCSFFQNFPADFLVWASTSFILTKQLLYGLFGLKLGGSATFYLHFLHEVVFSLITVAANLHAANKAEVRFALAKYNYFG